METFWYRLTQVHLENGHKNRMRGRDRDRLSESECYSVHVSSLLHVVTGPPLLNGRCTSLLRAPVSKITYTVSSGTLNSSIRYHTIPLPRQWWCMLSLCILGVANYAMHATLLIAVNSRFFWPPCSIYYLWWYAVKHILIECSALSSTCNKHFTASSMKDLFDNVAVRNIFSLIKESHFYCTV